MIKTKLYEEVEELISELYKLSTIKGIHYSKNYELILFNHMLDNDMEKINKLKKEIINLIEKVKNNNF